MYYSAVFTVQVRTGMEFRAKEMLEYLMKRQKTGIKAVHIIASFTQKLVGREKDPQLRCLTPGYIFVEMNKPEDYKPKFVKTKGRVTDVPFKIWHIIKSVPLVQRILDDEMTGEEFWEFAKSIDCDATIESTLPGSVEKQKKEAKELLHKANTTNDKKEMKEYLKQYEAIEKTTAEEVAETLEEVREELQDQMEHIETESTANTDEKAEINEKLTFIEKCQAFINKRKKETFRFPMSFFERVYKKIDPDGKTIPRKKILTPTFIIPVLVEHLREHLRNEIRGWGRCSPEKSPRSFTEKRIS
ncbi:hypothetical protein L1765_10175 [Microaerobacter geothermalis]|uniref:transcription termination/antitermination NusG family protein n=1 Tax=Microaerobacter geothermalis TaxID=674972 RepID=UPI001F258080|nr:transcription termination/antitermination NusG family protein [Microaerobacter geothermalis]MCF6094329.1 hypothetical protein [Microaerobacter geothermalis]